MKANRGSIRREILVSQPAEVVWELVGDPARIHEWFPGIEASEVSEEQRVVSLSSGQSIVERIVTLDPLQRRFQYEIPAPLCRSHLGTLDVIALDDQSCLVIYGTDAEPALMALTIGGAAGAALRNVAVILEGGR